MTINPPKGRMKTVRLSRIATAAGALALILSACVPAQQYDALENDYNQLNQRLSGEISAQQVHISRLQGAIKVAVNSDLLFPSGSWQMPPQAAQLIAKMAPILAPFQQTTIIVTGYTDSTPIGPELRQQGVDSNQQLSLKGRRRWAITSYRRGSIRTWSQSEALATLIRSPRMTRHRVVPRTAASS
jgi:outer membrane protein OmpA-like peptidoglycan-associated protein